MYLEISGRQTGKTTRLLDCAEKFIRNRKKILICCLHQRSCQQLRNNLIQRIGIPIPTRVIFCTYSTFKETEIEHDIDQYFFDEFDFGCAPQINVNYIKKNGYYSTSLRFYRDAKYCRQYSKRYAYKAIAFDLLLMLKRVKRSKNIHTYTRAGKIK